MLKITVEDVGHAVILHCVGRIVRGEETTILCSAVQHHGRNVIVNLSEVSGIDAAGIGALVALQAAGVYLKLMNPSELVREVLRVTQLESIFEITEVPASGKAMPADGSSNRLSGIAFSGVAAAAV